MTNGCGTILLMTIPIIDQAERVTPTQRRLLAELNVLLSNQAQVQDAIAKTINTLNKDERLSYGLIGHFTNRSKDVVWRSEQRWLARMGRPNENATSY